MQTLIYLHGFRSSSRSKKAGDLAAALLHVHADWELITPDLSPDPAVAMAQIGAITARCGDPAQNITLIGSSLGGFYAHVVAETLACRAVLLNPSLHPDLTLAAHVGTQTNWHSDEQFLFSADHLEILRSLQPQKKPQVNNEQGATDAADLPVIANARYLIVVEMGDELLNHNETLAAFPTCQSIVIDGGNHDLLSFPKHLGAVLRFAGLADSEI